MGLDIFILEEKVGILGPRDPITLSEDDWGLQSPRQQGIWVPLPFSEGDWIPREGK